MSVLEAIILGIIQGITEFLPVSSSGHIELGRLFLFPDRLNAMEEALFFIVMVHVATLVPVIVLLRRDVLRVLRGLGEIITHPSKVKESYREDVGVRLAVLIVIGTIPTVIVALAIKQWVLDGLFTGVNSAVAVAVFLFLTSAALLLSDRLDTGAKEILGLGLKDALFVGTIQGIAVFPGISRSGATICASLAIGMRRALAARFSFLLSVPVILAGACYESIELARGGVQEELGAVFAGALAAAAVGFPALMLVVRLVKRGKLGRFAYYLVPLGLFALIWVWRMSGA